MSNITVEVTIQITNLVLDPYTQERWKVIQIQKESGVNRARTDKSRNDALSAHLAKKGMTLKDYSELVSKADVPFTYNEEGAHVLPEATVSAMLVSVNNEASRAMKITHDSQVRSRIQASEMELEFDENDVEDWERFVVVKQGSGAKLSNQRALRTNKRIKSVVGRFTLTFSPDFVSPKKLREALEWGGQHVGIGASRKMGMGRFTVTGFEQS